ASAADLRTPRRSRCACGSLRLRRAGTMRRAGSSGRCSGLLCFGQRESLVALGCDVVALLYICGETEERHEHPRLAGHVRAEFPRVARREQREVGNRVDEVDPRVLRLERRLDALMPVLTQVLDALGDPV